MADQKITQLTADTSPSSTDLLKTVKDPAGTPLDRKVTLLDILKGAALGVLTGDGDLFTRTSGALARLTRASLAADAAFTGAFAPLPGTWTTYTPTWGSSGTQPAIGNGTIAGASTQIGKLLHGRIALQMGSTTTYGTGVWTLTLPAGKTTVNAGIGQSGPILTYDASANVVSLGASNTPANSSVISLFTSTTNMTGTAPWTWATGDQVFVQYTLEIQ